MRPKDASLDLSQQAAASFAAPGGKQENPVGSPQTSRRCVKAETSHDWTLFLVASLFLVVRPGALSSVLAPSSDALVPSSDIEEKSTFGFGGLEVRFVV